MRKKLVTLIAISAFALVGCVADDVDEGAGPSPEEASKTSAKPVAESEIEAKALEIGSSPTDSVATDPVELQKNKSYEEQTDDFLAFINPEFSGWTGELPPQEDLISAAKLVCEQLRNGKPYSEVEAIKGSIYKFTKEQDEKLNIEEKMALLQTPLFENNQNLVNAASSAYCLEESF